MVELHSVGLVNLIGKRLAPLLSRVANARPVAGVTSLLEAYLAILRGKGAGSGWGMAAEVSVARRLAPGEHPTVLDLGAHVGDWSRAFRSLAPKSRMILVEPQPGCQAALNELRDERTTVIEAAVGCERGWATLYKEPGLSEKASLHQRGDSFLKEAVFEAIEVPVTTVGQIIEEHGLECVDFMKMDLEGHELEALAGADGALNDGTIKAIAFEFGGANVNSRTYFRDFWDLLTGYGYRIARILPSGQLLEIAAYDEDCEHFRSVSNYVAWRC